jgi:glucans biosynthesis protein
MRILRLVSVLILLMGCAVPRDAAAGAPPSAAAPSMPFAFAQVVARARALAAEGYRDPHGVDVPQWLLDIDYDQMRDIRFRTDRSLWRGTESPFEVQFFHAGLYFDRTVHVHEIDAAGRVTDVPFDPALFVYGKNKFAKKIPRDMGFAGFRLHYPIKHPKYKDEAAVFVGASYFRAIGAPHVYGLSARALAIDTARPTPEEFPFFREWWLARPAAAATEVTLYALLDSPRATGAYQFSVRPGEATEVDVDARVFLRAPVEVLGLAPLTSMFAFGENDPPHREDYRPEVHDSDGLLLHDATGEWIWRPLDNPRELRVNAFSMTNPRGFGLIQRDRDFEHYQDLETHMEKRPSLWIEPRGDWGAGAVELVRIASHEEINDNIVAYWKPARMPQPLEETALAYRMSWYSEDAARPPGGRVASTRRDRGNFYLWHVPESERGYRYLIDFEGEALAKLAPDEKVEAVVSVGPTGKLVEQQLLRNPVNQRWRLSFLVKTAGAAPVELRAFLRRDSETLTETWSYTLEP